MDDLAVIEYQADKMIRRTQIGGVWYFSVVDVITVLTDSVNPRKYWTDMCRRIVDEGFVEVAAKCRQLKMPASDGKQRLTDVADTETILRIVQSVPSPKAEPIKQWLARTGAIDLGARSVRPVDSEDTVAIPKLDTELLALAEYHERLAMVYRQQASMSTRLESVEAVTRSHDQQLLDILLRVESLETGSGVLPDMLALLRPENLSKDHQTQLKRWTSDLTYLTGWHRNMIWQDLVADFGYETFGDATDADWQLIADWFNERLAYFNKR